jgi:hypothetical protein
VLFESGETLTSSDSALIPFQIEVGECNIYAELIKGKWTKVKILETINGVGAVKVKATSSSDSEWITLSSIRVDKKFFDKSNDSLKQKLFAPNKVMFQGISFVISIENKAEGK